MDAELLERAIGYTRGTLAGVSDDLLQRRTPCQAWRLADLLDHMADSLDAFTEASTGFVLIEPSEVQGTRVELLRAKACTLLGAWSSPAAATVRLGAGAQLDARLLLGAAALEVTLHGWDVGQATGSDLPVPEALAGALLPVARALIDAGDRGVRFGEEVPLEGPGRAAELLGFCGRRPLQHHSSHE